MAVRITNETYTGVDTEGVRWTERERYVSGEQTSAAVYDDHIYLTIGGMPEIPMDWDRVWDLREVLDAALTLRHK